VFEVSETGDGVRIRRGERTWTVPHPGPGTPLGETIVEGFTTTDAAHLTDPVSLLLSGGGQLLQQQGQRWPDRLAKAAVVGSFAPLLQPFGEASPSSPGRPLPTDRSGRRIRVATPPALVMQYPSRVHYLVGGAEASGVPDGPIEFEGRRRTRRRTVLFPLTPDQTVPDDHRVA
jgi:hypothetical protein